MNLRGFVTGVLLEGYRRHFVLREEAAEIEYWIAGSNSTRSIAAHSVVFELLPDDERELLDYANTSGHMPVPGLVHKQTGIDSVLAALDAAPRQKDEATLDFVLSCLENEDEVIITEAVQVLRAFESLINSNGQLQTRTEQRLLKAMRSAPDAVLIYMAEDLGYIGTEASTPALGTLLSDGSQVDDVRWACAIALGRLPGDQVVDALLDGLTSEHEWTVAAALLGLSRRAVARNQSVLEPVFGWKLSALAPPLIRRYACLGLSRFDELSAAQLDALTEILGDGSDASPLELKGYAALALSSCLRRCPDTVIKQCERLVDELTRSLPRQKIEPETVWALEFLAELATLLELNDASAQCHAVLSTCFSDWRAPYYKALSKYAEAEGLTPYDKNKAGELFAEALSVLPKVQDTYVDDRATVSFRREIVEARVKMHEVVSRWIDAVDPRHLPGLADELRAVGAVYARYSQPGHLGGQGLKQLSEREREYLNSTRRLVDAMADLVRVDAALRMTHTDIEAIRRKLLDIAEKLRPLKDEFNNNLARSLFRLVDDVLQRIGVLHAALRSRQDSAEDDQLRSSVLELRSLFSRATWPMPARACPISGLGRGTLRVMKEDVPGDGTADSPYLYLEGTPAILNVITEIAEMAPGGSTKATVICKGPADVTIGEQPVPIVEGTFRATFDLGQLSPRASTLFRLFLVFAASDCTQTAATLEVSARSEK
jgi:HEAT repeat protein